MDIKAMNTPQYQLLFGVRRSIRYHDRRRAFFEFLHRVTAGLTVLLAGSVLFEVARLGETAWWLTTISIFAAVLAAWDIVVGYSEKAKLHLDLKRGFGALEIAMIAGDGSPQTWNDHELARLRIEQDEPPIFRALDVLCQNELLIAEGIKNDEKNSQYFGRVNFWQLSTRHFFHWSNITA